MLRSLFTIVCLLTIWIWSIFAQDLGWWTPTPPPPPPPGNYQPVEWEWFNGARDTSLDWNTDNEVQLNSANRACPKDDITLNIDFPFIGRCIKKSLDSDPNNTTIVNVFPKLTWKLVRLVMTIIVIMWFLGILVGWFMIAWNGALGTKQQWRKLIITIVLWLILLGATWIILNMLNPEFFGTNS